MESIQSPVSQLFKMCSIYCSGHTPRGRHPPDCKFILLLGLLSPNPCHTCVQNRDLRIWLLDPNSVSRNRSGLHGLIHQALLCAPALPRSPPPPPTRSRFVFYYYLFIYRARASFCTLGWPGGHFATPVVFNHDSSASVFECGAYRSVLRNLCSSRAETLLGLCLPSLSPPLPCPRPSSKPC